MSDVVDLKQWQEAQQPHMQGQAVCLHCRHTWVSVSRVGVVGLTCPECGLDKGVYAGLHSADKYDKECACGNVLYRISEKRIYCVLCGKEVEF